MISFACVCVLLLLGVAIRAIVSPIARARIPASVVAGLLGCVVALVLQQIGGERVDVKVQSILADFGAWGTTLISIVFAGLLLAPEGEAGTRSRDVWQQGIAAWIIILGQLAIGLIAFALVIKPLFPELPGPFGQYIEVTMAGGFGSANAMGTLLAGEKYGFSAGRDLLVFGATVGLLWGVVSGLFLAKFGQRRGWTHQSSLDQLGRGTGVAPMNDAPRISIDGIDSFLFQLCFLMIAYGIGLLMQTGVERLGISLDARFQTVDTFKSNLGNLPLFFFALLGGWLLRLALKAMGLSQILDRDMIHRLCGIAMDVLIVTSLARMSFALVGGYLWPMLLLLALGSIWAAFCLIWVSPRILPTRYWFELGLINYGFSTAATAQGMMFLKIVDPKLKSGAAETYALGAPLTAPFIGGGAITFLVLPSLIGWLGALAVGVVTIVLVIVLYVLGRRMHN